MQVDFMVVGQGLAGSLLAYNLLQSGKSVLVLNQFKPNAASRVAAGLYNPITGQRSVKTWLADRLFPFLENYYAEIQQQLGVRFLYPLPIFRPFGSIEEQNTWFGQSAGAIGDCLAIPLLEPGSLQGVVHAPFGGLSTQRSGYIDVVALVDAMTTYFQHHECYLEEEFDASQCEIQPHEIQYKHFRIGHLVCCQGEAARRSPFFSYLPLNGTKGQLLDIRLLEGALDKIVSKGVFVLPLTDRLRVGATYEWTYENEHPTEQGRIELCAKLAPLLKLPYEVIGQRAGLRPTVKDRKPLLGTHPIHRNVHVFNGLGTKGVSLAPYFSEMMAQYLLADKPLMQEVDIDRFAYLYHSNK